MILSPILWFIGLSIVLCQPNFGSIGEEALGPKQPERLHSPLSLQCCHLMQDQPGLQKCVDDTAYVLSLIHISEPTRP